MPPVMLVPNARNQTQKINLNFSQIVKSVMLLAYLGQKKNSAQLKELAKDQLKAGMLQGKVRER